jgi:hypothetical protein
MLTGILIYYAFWKSQLYPEKGGAAYAAIMPNEDRNQYGRNHPPRRVPELAELILSTMPAVTTDHPVVQAVAKLIQGNCDHSWGYGERTVP